MKKIRIILVTLLSLFLFTGCNNKNSSYDMSYPYRGEVEKSSEQFVVSNEPIFIKTSSAGITVENPKDKDPIILAKVNELGGTLKSKSTSSYSTNYYYSFEIPNEKLEDFVSFIEEIGELRNISESIQNVTDNYINSLARKEALEQKLEDYEELKTTLTTETALVNVIEKIAQINEELTVINKTIEFYDGRVACSIFELTVYEKYTYHEPSFIDDILDTFGTSTASVGEFLKGIVIVIVAILPYILLFGGLFGIYCLIKLIICKAKKIPFTLFKNAIERSKQRKEYNKIREAEIKAKIEENRAKEKKE